MVEPSFSATARRILHYGLVLLVVSGAAALGLGLLYRVARPQMDKNAEKRKNEGLQALFADVPGVTFEACTAEVEDGRGGKKKVTYWKAVKDGGVVGYVCEGAARGYSSTVRVLVRVDAGRGVVEGIKVTSSAETPGLGERINEVKSSVTLVDKVLGRKCEKGCPNPWFQEKFKGLPVKNIRFVSSPEEEKAGNGVMAISGATVSSTAVLNAVKKAVDTLARACGTAAGKGGAE